MYNGIVHSSDWYRTLVHGVAGVDVPDNTGIVPLDSINLWDAITGSSSPQHIRTEVVHQVSNDIFSEGNWKVA